MTPSPLWKTPLRKKAEGLTSVQAAIETMDELFGRRNCYVVGEDGSVFASVVFPRCNGNNLQTVRCNDFIFDRYFHIQRPHILSNVVGVVVIA
jgi:hypothetical protein